MCNYNKDACQHDPYIGDKIKLGTAGLDYDEIVLAGLLPNLLYLLKEHADVEAKIEIPADWVDPRFDGV
jgi:hypothetical protein